MLSDPGKRKQAQGFHAVLGVGAWQALDLAGTYGVLSLFGVLPAASVWSQRYGGQSSFSAFKVTSDSFGLRDKGTPWQLVAFREAGKVDMR